MSVLQYKHKDFDGATDKSRFTTKVYDENLLVATPLPTHYENSVCYGKSESRQLESFECAISCPPAGYSVSEGQRSEFLIVYVAEGQVYCNGMEMQRGDAVFIEPYCSHSLVCGDGERTRLYLVSWKGDITVHLAQMLRNFTSDKIYKVGFVESVPGLFDSIIYNRYLSAISVKQLVVGFTDMLLAYLTRAEQRDSLGKKPADLINRAKSAIETGYADLTVDRLASLLYVNSKYLSKMFRKYTGMTPKRYITEIKMTHAEHYLANTEYPIQKVSEIVGYNNYTNFYIAFKSKYGMAPEEYRRQYSDHDGVHHDEGIKNV